MTKDYAVERHVVAHMAIWTFDIAPKVFTIVMNEFSEDLKTKYKMQKIKVNGVTTWKNFSTSQVSETPPIFPYITIIELPGAERGQDLEGSSINGGLFTFQVDVFDNDKESKVQKCMEEVMRIMKTMRFQVNAMPSFDSKPQEYRMTARFSRVIADNDPL